MTIQIQMPALPPKGGRRLSSLMLISPVDGSVYAERPVNAIRWPASPSRRAQKDWAKTPA
jgi:hypothetical protein